mgnify:CR=1 FL=1
MVQYSNMKTPRIVLIIVLLFVAGLLSQAGEHKKIQRVPTTNDSTVVDRRFTGVLSEFNSGCYADAECHAVVDEKHVTVVIGWSQEVAGSVIGTENGMGELYDRIGEKVDVYAQYLGGDKYSLYGSEEYYIKVK